MHIGCSPTVVLNLILGGWGGSYWFSQAVSSSANRSTFVNAAVSAVNTYGLDGIDIDWVCIIVTMKDPLLILSTGVPKSVGRRQPSFHE